MTFVDRTARFGNAAGSGCTRPAHYAAQGSPSPDALDAFAPSGVNGSHPLLHEKTRLAVLLFLASEFVFFVFLIVAYIYSQSSEINGPTAQSSLVPWKTGIYTVLLLLSSGTIYLAEKSLESNRKRFALWMSATILLGAAFLFGEMREYAGLLHKDISISRNLFGSTYFTLTGFHGIHVTLGLLMLLTITGLVMAGKLGQQAPRGVPCGELLLALRGHRLGHGLQRGLPLVGGMTGELNSTRDLLLHGWEIHPTVVIGCLAMLAWYFRRPHHAVMKYGAPFAARRAHPGSVANLAHSIHWAISICSPPICCSTCCSS